MLVVASGYSSVELERVRSQPAAERQAIEYLRRGHDLVSIWEDADFDSRLSVAEPMEQLELVRSRSDRLAGALRMFGTEKSPVTLRASRAATLSDRERRGAR